MDDIFCRTRKGVTLTLIRRSRNRAASLWEREKPNVLADGHRTLSAEFCDGLGLGPARPRFVVVLQVEGAGMINGGRFGRPSAGVESFADPIPRPPALSDHPNLRAFFVLGGSGVVVALLLLLPLFLLLRCSDRPMRTRFWERAS